MLKIGVIGAGLLGSRHARVYGELPGCELAAVCDLDPGRAEAVGKRFGARPFTDVDEMLASGLDAVSVATPDHAHTAPVRACLAAGAHVLVEKPLTLDPAEARSLVADANERRRVLMVNYSQRWLPEHRRIDDLLADGTLGEVVFVGSRRWDAAWVPGRMIAGWAARTTPIHFMSSHDIDLILRWVGRPVERVQAEVHRGGLGLPGVVDGYDALVRLQGGASVSLHSSWVMPESFPVAADTRLELLGTRGALLLTGSTREMELYRPGARERIAFGGPATADEVGGRLAGAFVESLRSFVAAVQAGDLAAPTSAARTLDVVDLQAAIIAAAER
jgi:predicted dehydrogenase